MFGPEISPVVTISSVSEVPGIDAPLSIKLPSIERVPLMVRSKYDVADAFARRVCEHVQQSVQRLLF